MKNNRLTEYRARARMFRINGGLYNGMMGYEVYDTRTGEVLVTDNVNIRVAFQDFIQGARIDVAALDRVLRMGHPLKSWKELVEANDT